MIKMQEIYTVLTSVKRKSKHQLNVTIQVTNKRSGSSKTAVLAFDLRDIEGDVNEIPEEGGQNND